MNSSTNDSAPMPPVFEGDRAAWAVLKDNFTDTRGVIRPKLGHTPTEREFQAVDYLCGEWDYGYEPPHDSGAPLPASAPQETPMEAADIVRCTYPACPEGSCCADPARAVSGETPDQRPADGDGVTENGNG